MCGVCDVYNLMTTMSFFQIVLCRDASSAGYSFSSFILMQLCRQKKLRAVALESRLHELVRGDDQFVGEQKSEKESSQLSGTMKLRNHCGPSFLQV